MGKLSKEDLILIHNLRIEKKWGAKKMIAEFPNKLWKLQTLKDLIKKIELTGSAARISGSGRPRTVRTTGNVLLVKNLICSPINSSRIHKSPREIERETGISRSSVSRIVKLDLKLKVFKRIPVQLLSEANKLKRLTCCQQLLDHFPSDRSVRRVWFTDEKLFHLSTPVNSQNDRVYSLAEKKALVEPNRLLTERSHFSKSIMVSVGVSKIGKTGIIFVEPGAKIDSAYYCYHLLEQGLFPAIRAICGHHDWILQQDGAPSHRAANTILFLKKEKVQFIEPKHWPPNSPDLNPVDYAVWGALQQRVYKHKIRDLSHLKEIIKLEWSRISMRFIIRSIEQWRSRLNSILQQNGGHIEHLFK
jgi:hypothetical protein